MNAPSMPAVALEQVDQDPKLILLGKVDQDTYFEQLRKAVQSDDETIETKAARDRVKSLAQSIRTRKAAIDRSRKDLTEGWRKQTKAVNEVGKTVIGKLDALIEEVRAPVTAWEEAEAKREAEADAIIADLESAGTVTYGTSSEEAQQRLDRIRGINLNPEVLGVRLEMAADLQRKAVETLSETVEAIKAAEERERENARLRAEAAAAEERRQREERERLANERAEAEAKAEQERIEKAREEAAERARQEAAEQARREREEQERAAQAEIEAANRRAAEAEAAAQAERDRLEREARERQEREARAAAEARKREADIAHREHVIETAAQSLTGLSGMSQKLARAVINEIAAGNVPAVKVTF